MALLADLAFFIGFFFVASLWYWQEKRIWSGTEKWFGGDEHKDPKHKTMKHVFLMNDFTWGFGGLLMAWVALSISQSLPLFPLYIAVASLILLGIQATRKINKWVIAGFLIALLAAVSNALFSF